jgi:hypothetical protein
VRSFWSDSFSEGKTLRLEEWFVWKKNASGGTILFSERTYWRNNPSGYYDSVKTTLWLEPTFGRNGPSVETILLYQRSSCTF